MSRDMMARAEKWRADNLQAALIILADLKQFPPESLAHRWARLVMEATKREEGRAVA
jgi:hypothetical protein